MPLKAVDPNLLLLANAADGYGQVNAPSWALPAGAFFVILLAGIPALLAPGEKVRIYHEFKSMFVLLTFADIDTCNEGFGRTTQD